LIKVTLLDHMGSDLTVVNAARVSFNKEAKEFTDRDTKLIKYLADHNHWSPFSHPQVQFRVAAPVFVARQLQKHTVGLAWNEVSRRYVDTEPTFYTPEVWRKRAESVKQGSSEEAVDIKEFRSWNTYDPYTAFINAAEDFYKSLLDQGVCPEQARMVLPQSMMTEWIWTGSLYAFARVCNLRLDSHTQKETQIVAEQISSHMDTLFPVSWSALVSVRDSSTTPAN
jgi:thymidylate synthase (FAD)